MAKMRHLMGRLGLTVNDRKTRLVRVPKERFDFLGYTVGRFHARYGTPFIGTAPSRKSILRVMRAVHEETSRRWNTTTIEKRILEVNRILRGWAGYFNQGPVKLAYRIVRIYTERRIQRWLMLKHKRRGTGYRQYPERVLYERYGLFHLVAPGKESLPSAKA